MLHAIIGANIMDRLVKCPGSLKLGYGSLEQSDRDRTSKSGKRFYTQNRIENNSATLIGMKIDEMSKNFLRYEFSLKETHHYVSAVDYIDDDIVNKAKDYYMHMKKLRTRFGKAMIDPVFDLSEIMPNLPNVEFRVQFNPDFVAFTPDGSVAYISELYTGKSLDRNKMFQVICCAVGYARKHPDCKKFICETYNPSTKLVEILKLNRDEVEAYLTDIIIPALDRVKAAIADNRDNIENYRHVCSWCRNFCIFKDEGCAACHSSERYAANEVIPDVEFYYNNMTDSDKAAYKAIICE